jgi:hypothetical protein
MGDDPMALLGLEGALKHYYYYYYLNATNSNGVTGPTQVLFTMLSFSSLLRALGCVCYV